MSANNPEDVNRQFAEAFNAADVDAMLALYEPGGSLVMGPGQVATGVAALREALNSFMAMKPVLKLEWQPAVIVGDLALTSSTWTLTGTDPSGAPVSMSGASAEIVRRQPDGTWLMVIDNPFVAAL